MSERQAIPPALPDASRTPGMVASHDQLFFRVFNGMDTKSPRAAVDDRMCWWISGLMPVGPSYLRILPGIGPNIYQAPGGTTVIWHGYGCIGSSPDPTATETDVGVRYYGVVLLSDGSMQAFNTDTGEVRWIMPPGTVLRPRTQFGFAQWGSDYFLFCADQPNGYWIWDEHNLFTAGTFSPIIDVTAGGKNYTSPPGISVQTTGAGTGATFAAQLEPGGDAVTKITVTNPGSGFAKNDFALLKFAGGNANGDATAWAVCDISPGGGVNQIIVENPGHGYTFATTVNITGGGGGFATAVPNIQNGGIVSITIINPGLNYTSAPNVTVNDPGYSGVSGGSGFYGYAINGLNGISAVQVTDGGYGYTEVPTVTIVGDGHGALFRAQIGGGVVTDIIRINPGQGYTAALALISGGNDAAAADNWQTLLMPYGWSGTSLEVYQSRMWMSNGAALADFPPRARLIWSAPGNPADASLGAGSSIGNDSFLKVGWFCLKQSNGYLYLIGDSSMNAVSNVQTTTRGQVQATATTPGDPGTVTTEFGNQNVDPQAGSPWPSSVSTLNRNIIFANSDGIQVAMGGAVQKVSGVLDGILPASPDIYGRQADFSSAVAQIFGIQVYCLLIPHLDLAISQVVNNLIMFDGQKFWTSPQDVQLTYIASQEILSQMVAWGTDGTFVFRLFQQPSDKFVKTVISKYWDNPGIDWDKTGIRLYGVFQDFPLDYPVLAAVDNTRDPPFTVTLQANDPGMQTVGTAVWGPYPSGQQGQMFGLTVRTIATQGNLISLLIRSQDMTLRT